MWTLLLIMINTVKPRFSPVSYGKHQKSLHYHHIYVHPCVIKQQACIVYPKGLQHQLPTFYNKLKLHYQAQGYVLKEDQRCKESKNTRIFERRRWMPVLLFTASMFFDSLATADTGLQQVEFRLMANSQTLQHNISVSKSLQKSKYIHSQSAIELYQILNQHYVTKKTDPVYIQNDLKEMAKYYSHFPEVISLITRLKQKNWTLSYDENIWSTVATGSMFQINKATIHFNTRSAAKLKLHNSCKNNPVCIASPSDALLHELLHTHSMLIKTQDFIRQGGMNTHRYPFQHEYSIIKQERQLYASMSKRDSKKRPQRNEHRGRKIIARCATCIK